MVIYTDLDHLTPDTEEAARLFLATLDAHGLNPRVLETYRTQDRQNELYRQYLAGENHKTNTQYSWHTAGRALDIGISKADTASILFFLDTAQHLGFSTVADPRKIRTALNNNATPDMWDWHHVSYHGGKNRIQAIAEYEELLDKGPHAPLTLLQLAGNMLLIVSIVGLFIHGTSSKKN